MISHLRKMNHLRPGDRNLEGQASSKENQLGISGRKLFSRETRINEELSIRLVMNRMRKRRKRRVKIK